MTHLKSLKSAKSKLDEVLSIFEKIDGTSLYLIKENNQIKFLNRDKKEINKIKRITTNLYEKGINFLEKSDLSFLKNGDWIQFEYFPFNNYLIKLDKLPKNNLIVIDSNLSFEQINLDVDFLTPIIDNKKLTNEQIEALLNDNIDLNLIKKLNSNYKIKLGNKDIEGLVIVLKNKKYKIVNENFTKEILNKKNEGLRFKEYIEELYNLFKYFNVNVPKDFILTEDSFIDLIFAGIKSNYQSLKKYKDNFERFNYGEDFIQDFSQLNFKKIPAEILYLLDEPFLKDFLKLALIKLYSKSKNDNQYYNNLYDKIHNDTIGLFIGRFSGFTKGHLDGLNFMNKNHKKSYLIIVQGEKTSKNHKKNPFTFEQKLKMILPNLPKNVEIKEVKDGFFVNIIKDLKGNNYTVYCSKDRLETYYKQLKYLPKNKNILIKEIDFDRKNISATSLRKSIENNDYEEFKKQAPEKNWSLWNELKNILG